jgi:hypothetical protein
MGWSSKLGDVADMEQPLDPYLPAAARVTRRSAMDTPRLMLI